MTEPIPVEHQQRPDPTMVTTDPGLPWWGVVALFAPWVLTVVVLLASCASPHTEARHFYATTTTSTTAVVTSTTQAPAPPPTAVARASRKAPVPRPRPPGAGATTSGRCGGSLPPCSVMMCESKGDNTARNRTSSASGKWQITNGTWNGYGGYASAADAPESVQDEKARQLWAGGAGASHWRACL